jgi:hypothetical protein
MPDHVICPAIYLRCLSRSDRSFLRLDGTDPAPTVPFGMRHKPLQLSPAKACGLVWSRSTSCRRRLWQDLAGLRRIGHSDPLHIYAAYARATRSASADQDP